MNLDELPDIALLQILSNILPEDLADASLLCHSFSTLINVNQLWEEKYRLHFPHLMKDIDPSSSHSWRKLFWKAYREEYFFLGSGKYSSYYANMARLFSVIKENNLYNDEVATLIEFTPFNTFGSAVDLIEMEHVYDANDRSIFHWARQVGNQSALNHIYHKVLDRAHSIHYPARWWHDWAYDSCYYPASVQFNFQQTILYWAIVSNQSLTFVNHLLDVGSALNEEYKLQRYDYAPLPFWYGAPFGRLPQPLKIFHPVHLAARYGRLDLLRDWLQKGLVSVNDQDGFFRNPLYWALEAKQAETALFLLEEGADITQVSYDSHSEALHLAAKQGLTAALKKILASDQVDIESLDKEAYTALHLAIRYSQSEAAIELINAGASLHAQVRDEPRRGVVMIKPVHAAAINGLQDVVACIIKKDPAMLNELDSGYKTAFRLALDYKHEALAQYFISQNADMGLPRSDHLMHLLAKRGLMGLTKNVIPNASSVNAKDGLTRSPLFFAAKYNHLDMAQYLIQHGADINAKELVLWLTPLKIAISKGHDEMVMLLLKHGAKRSHISAFGVSEKVRLLWQLLDYIELREKPKDKYTSSFSFFGETYLFGQARVKELEAASILRDVVVYDRDPADLHMEHRNVLWGDRLLKRVYEVFLVAAELSKQSRGC